MIVPLLYQWGWNGPSSPSGISQGTVSPTTATSKGCVPAVSVAGVSALSFPPAPISYCETLFEPWSATYTFLQLGVTAMPTGFLAVGTGGLHSLSSPPDSLLYCETVPPP